ncbi:MAG: hypothetical protein QOF41_2243 [Methylobacteriaceae bacterium]|nr:hypothetical protein [Methylobacteriaceae bacterium]
MSERFENRKASRTNALDIFEGQWLSALPNFGYGGHQLFDDARITQFDRAIGGFFGKKILELGPLEGGHTYAMSLLGASEIIAVEANRDAFLRCLIVKELYGLKAKFMCGDFEKYLLDSPPRVDVILASGVLYHMVEPLQLIEAMAKSCDTVCMWTHYFDEQVIRSNQLTSERFGEEFAVDFHGRKITLARQNYGTDVKTRTFAGGTEEHSHWIRKEGIADAFDVLGFDLVELSEHRDHPHGPSYLCVARRRLRGVIPE